MSTLKDWLGRRSLLVVTHTYTTGPSLELLEYLVPRTRTVGFIAHPFSYCEDTRSTFTLYRHGQRVECSTARSMFGPDPAFYAKDSLLTWLYLLKGRQQYDVAIAADPLNTAALLAARRLGLVRRLVYWTIDYTPHRFTQRLLNDVYHAFDRMACYGSDLIWNSSSRIIDARENAPVPIPRDRCAPQLTVPDGNHYERTPHCSFTEIDRYSVAFLGHLVPKGGVELLMQAFPHVVKAVPQARLVIIGGGPLLESLRRMARELAIADSVVFHGHIADHRDVEKILSHCAIAAAPYQPDEASVSVYSEVGKPKAYLAAGLPVVLTSVPEIAHTIADRDAGVVVQYSRESLCAGIVGLLSSEQRLRNARAAALALGASYSWDKVFDRALGETLGRLQL